ncbi:hypothetical protein ACLB2K_031654 [Fragaria x ananassa]
MAGRRGGGRGGLDRDFEIEELKRQGQELQERLDQRNLPGTEDERSSGSAEDENPFHEDPSQSSNGEDSPHVRSQKIGTADKVLTSSEVEKTSILLVGKARQREREGRSKIRAWEKMKRELKRKYLPEDYRQENFLKLHNFKQMEMSVEDFTGEYEDFKSKL